MKSVTKSIVRQSMLALFWLSVLTGQVMAHAPGGIAKGATALSSAASDLKAYFNPVATIIYIIAAIVGLVGAFRIYSKWQNGDQDVQKAAVGWLGSILFLLAVAAILQAVFY